MHRDAFLVEKSPKPTSPEVSINTHLQDEIRKLKNRRGEMPCTQANVHLVQIEPDDYDNLQASANYIYAPVRKFIEESLIPYYSSFDIDIFNLNGIATVKDLGTGEVNKISPPLAAINENSQIQVFDGHDRVIIARDLGKPITIAVIDNVDMGYLTDGLATPFNEVKEFDRFPKKSEKKRYRQGVQHSQLVDISSFGSRGQRTSLLQREKSLFPDDPTKGNKNLSRQVNLVFRKLNASGLFPSAINIEQSPDRESRVVEVNDVIPLDDKHFLADFNIDWQGDISPPSHYTVVTETSRESKTPANLVVFTTEKYDSSSIPPAVEISIPAQVRAQINEQFTKLGFAPIAAEDDFTPTPDTSIGSEFTLVNSNPGYFSTVTIFAGDQGHSYIINHPKERDSQARNGTAIILRTKEGVFLKRRYRELFGMTFVELPRMFGFDLVRSYRETGIDLENQVDFIPERILPEVRHFSLNKLSIISGNIHDNVIPDKPYQKHDGQSKEISELVLFKDQEIHKLISDGNLNCDITNASITVDQLSRGILVANPSKEPDNNYVVLEKYLSPLESKYYFQPPKTSTGTGDRIGQNNFPDTGVALIFQHTELGTLDSLPSGKCYQSFSINEVVEMMISGQLDTTAIANLSTALRNQGYLIIAQ